MGVADLSEALECLGSGSAETDLRTNAGGGELCRAGKLVGLAVLGGGHAVRQIYVRGQAQVGFTALVADESALGIYAETPIHSGPDGLTNAG